jgi:hypothetical protein
MTRRLQFQQNKLLINIQNESAVFLGYRSKLRNELSMKIARPMFYRHFKEILERFEQALGARA